MTEDNIADKPDATVNQEYSASINKLLAMNPTNSNLNYLVAEAARTQAFGVELQRRGSSEQTRLVLEELKLVRETVWLARAALLVAVLSTIAALAGVFHK